MKCSMKNIFSGPVSKKDEITIELSNDKMKELIDALRIVRSYDKIARKATKTKFADWSEIDYVFQENTVIITVRQGACG